MLSVVGAGAAFAQAADPAPAPAPAEAGLADAAPAAPDPEEPASFFDGFDRLSDTRWQRSDGWRNGDYQSCTWTRGEAAVFLGVLELTVRQRPRNGTAFTCAEVQSTRRYHYGTYEARIKVAKGSGINSNIFTYIGPPHGVPEHDEVDFEFLGKDTTKVQLNYWRAGNGKNEVMIDLGFDASEDFHTYAFTWSKDKIIWYIDGKKVHETPEGADLPKNPGIFFMSIWTGSEVVNDWLGPFTYPEKRPVIGFDWIAYTEEGEKCLFPESITCSTQ